MIVAGLFLLSVLSGMLGLGVAFAAVPFLGVFLPDVVHQVQPLSLVLNGLTAASSAIGFARSKLVDWRSAMPLAAVTTASAPFGALLAQRADARVVWVLYLASVGARVSPLPPVAGWRRLRSQTPPRPRARRADLDPERIPGAWAANVRCPHCRRDPLQAVVGVLAMRRPNPRRG